MAFDALGLLDICRGLRVPTAAPGQAGRAGDGAHIPALCVRLEYRPRGHTGRLRVRAAQALPAVSSQTVEECFGGVALSTVTTVLLPALCPAQWFDESGAAAAAAAAAAAGEARGRCRWPPLSSRCCARRPRHRPRRRGRRRRPHRVDAEAGRRPQGLGRVLPRPRRLLRPGG